MFSNSLVKRCEIIIASKVISINTNDELTYHWCQANGDYSSDSPQNLTLLQGFVKRGVFNDIWLHKGDRSVWCKRTDCVTRKITFNMRQWGAVHVTYSVTFLLWFSLMRVYLCVSEGTGVSEWEAQLCGWGSCGCYCPTLSQQGLMMPSPFIFQANIWGSFSISLDATAIIMWFVITKWLYLHQTLSSKN